MICPHLESCMQSLKCKGQKVAVEVNKGQRKVMGKVRGAAAAL